VRGFAWWLFSVFGASERFAVESCGREVQAVLCVISAVWPKRLFLGALLREKGRKAGGERREGQKRIKAARTCWKAEADQAVNANSETQCLACSTLWQIKERSGVLEHDEVRLDDACSNLQPILREAPLFVHLLETEVSG
jgi:hypothetical protein